MNWHTRYAQQAGWTRELRSYILDKAGLARARNILEVGCGTGAILSELLEQPGRHGLDIDRAALIECELHAPGSTLVQGDALDLPYADQAFDIVYSHFLLLWVHNPLQALQEQKRVTQPGGHVIAFAEPDYLSRLDSPQELIPLGRWQTESIQRQGADPGLGAKLANLVFEAGIKIVETGTIQSMGSEPPLQEWEMEWKVIESDLQGVVPDLDIARMKELDKQARQQGRRVLHVPTYFAWGQV